MTDDSGNTYAVDTAGNLIPASLPDGKVKVATVSLAVTVTYEGTATSDDDVIASMWEQTLSTNDVQVSAAASGTYASRVKFTSGTSNYAHAAANATVEIASATAKAWTFSSKSTGSKTMPNMYIAFDGGNKTSGSVQDDGAALLSAITVTFTPAAA